MPDHKYLLKQASELLPQTTNHGVGSKKNFIASGDISSPIIHADISSLASGEKVTLHAHPTKEETYYFISGEGVMEINGEQHPITPGCFVWIAATTEHALENTGGEDLIFIIHGVHSK